LAALGSALLMAAAALLLVVPAPSGIEAQAAPVVRDAGVEARFPDHLVFRAEVQASSEIERVRLHYKILPDGVAASGDAEFEPGRPVIASFALQSADQTTFYLPPGTVIEYHWEARDAAGNTATSEEQTFFYDDDRFQWKRLEDAGVTIYYYSGSDSDAAAMLETGREAIETMTSLLQTEIGFPIKAWVYSSVEDMRPALPRRSETYESQVITAGVRISSDTVLVLGNASFDTLRHELVHIVTAAAGEGPLGSLPAWLDEGTAVYGQGHPGGFREAVEQAIGRGNVFTLRSMTSPPGDPSRVALFYGQSWSIVSYLIDNYGEDKFARLFAEIKSGKRIDSALQAVYGFDQDGLEDEWRAFHGLPPRPTAEPTGPAEEIEQPAGDRPAAGSGGGASAGTVVLLAALVVALAGAIGLAGLVLARKFG
jgi:hypothetical protein